MPSFNQVILMGHATRDPTTKTLPNGTVVAELGLAMNREWTDKGTGQKTSEVCFVDLTAFGRTAEVIGEHVRKGKPLLVSGRLKQDVWEDRNGGGKRSKHTVVVDTFQFVGPKDDPDSAAGAFGEGGGGGRQQQSRPPPQRQPIPPAHQQGRPGPPRQASQRPAPASAPAAADQGPPFGDERQFSDADIPF